MKFLFLNIYYIIYIKSIVVGNIHLFCLYVLSTGAAIQASHLLKLYTTISTIGSGEGVNLSNKNYILFLYI
ncbi:hypothetical protein Indivirus_1_93 [Indivirus ILV1]|uniref:Uncharacterized protein n=1 Tax=Indivirus ILV1 TaxID=1977633 RepID=A0A1V0SCL9_9VIRU|nr:hypothetical protein Indivirus_1_93 [Indivirus ILV1]